MLYVTPTAPELTNLGHIVGPMHTDVYIDGSAWYRLAGFEPSAESTPWRAVLWTALEIDGVVQAEQGSFGYLGPNTPVACPSAPAGGLAPGPHTFRLAGGLWGEPATAFSDTWTITLDCPPPPPPESAGCIDMGTLPDGTPAGGFCPIDAGPPPPGDPRCADAGALSVCDPDDAESGGCSAVPGASRGMRGIGGASVLALFVGLTARRSRRRRR
jgi:hypothetical protein